MWLELNCMTFIKATTGAQQKPYSFPWVVIIIITMLIVRKPRFPAPTDSLYTLPLGVSVCLTYDFVQIIHTNKKENKPCIITLKVLHIPTDTHMRAHAHTHTNSSWPELTYPATSPKMCFSPQDLPCLELGSLWHAPLWLRKRTRRRENILGPRDILLQLSQAQKWFGFLIIF